MKFYTTKEQEKLLDKVYNLEIKKKEKELEEKERKTGKLQKYSASFYISKPSRVFICEDDQVYMKFGRKKIICPSEEVEDGGIYFVDPDFADKFNKFVDKCEKKYSIEFKIDNGSVRYCGGPNVYSSVIHSLCDDEMYDEYEDEDKYDLCCG